MHSTMFLLPLIWSISHSLKWFSGSYNGYPVLLRHKYYERKPTYTTGDTEFLLEWRCKVFLKILCSDNCFS